MIDYGDPAMYSPCTDLKSKTVTNVTRWQTANQPVAESNLSAHKFMQVAFTLAPFLKSDTRVQYTTDDLSSAKTASASVSHSNPGYVAVSQELG